MKTGILVILLPTINGKVTFNFEIKKDYLAIEYVLKMASYISEVLPVPMIGKDKITPIIVILFKTLSTAKFKGMRKREERNWIFHSLKTLYHKTHDKRHN